MPTTHRWIGTADAVAKGSSGAIASLDATPANNTFAITIGGVAVTVTGTTNVATTAAALVAAANASTHPYFAAITWDNPSSGNITATADTAGVDFTATLTKAGAGTGTVTAFSTTTANAGPNVWAAANFSSGSLPANSDTVIIENNSVPILWGLDQSGVTLAELRVMQSYTGLIGLDNSRFVTSVSGVTETTDTTKTDYRDDYLKIGATLLNIGQQTGGPTTPAGASRIKVNVGTAQTATTIYNTCTASADTYLQPCRWLGTHASNSIEVFSGTIGVATTRGNETSTVHTLKQHGGDVTLGSGVTLDTVIKDGGALIAHSVPTAIAMNADGDMEVIGDTGVTCPELACSGGTLTTTGGFAVALFQVTGGTAYPNATGTIDDFSLNGGKVDFTGNWASRTVGTLSVQATGGEWIDHLLISVSNGIVRDYTTSNVSLDSARIALRAVFSRL